MKITHADKCTLNHFLLMDLIRITPPTFLKKSNQKSPSKLKDCDVLPTQKMVPYKSKPSKPYNLLDDSFSFVSVISLLDFINITFTHHSHILNNHLYFSLHLHNSIFTHPTHQWKKVPVRRAINRLNSFCRCSTRVRAVCPIPY